MVRVLGPNPLHLRRAPCGFMPEAWGPSGLCALEPPPSSPRSQTWASPWQPWLQPLRRHASAFLQVYRCGRRRRCYPPSWQRWVFYLLPGIAMASVAIAIYTAMMTSDNYYYTHSIWHMLLAGSAAFLLPPRDQHTEPWACSQKLTCHYDICRNRQEELYTVT